MNILLQTKEDIETQFGMSATMAGNLLDMVAQGENAYGFLTGAMDAGFAVTVGLFNGKCRYVAFQKQSGSDWDQADVHNVLNQVGPFSNWSLTTGSDFFDYAEKNGHKIVASCTGWHSSNRQYAFIYVPTLQGEISILPDKSALDKKFPV